MIDQKILKKDIQNKHLLGIDYGRKFTGLGTYKVGIDPFPLAWGRIKYENDDQLIKEIQQIINDEFIEIIVVGLPFFTDGKESTMTKTIRAFNTKLAETVNLPVYVVDETLTTFEAEERMKNDPKYNFQVDLKQIDAVSATIIIEQFVKNSSDE